MTHRCLCVATAILLSCAQSSPNPQGKHAAGQADELERSHDAKTLMLALSDFAKRELWASDRNGVRRQIIVDLQTAGPSGYLSDQQIRSELRGEKWHIPLEVLASLRTRNEKQMSTKDIELGKEAVKEDLSELKGERDIWKPLTMKHPQAKAHVTLWMPGYSADTTRAVVRFSFGPTPHGATATYLLNRNKDGEWRIAGSKLNYYV